MRLLSRGEGMVCTHVRLAIKPDGGVERLRVFGMKYIEIRNTLARWNFDYSIPSKSMPQTIRIT